MSSDIDYILQAIGNEVRRKILLHVAREGPISYTKLMKRVGIEDSGTFGFHLRKMQKLLKKDDIGEYVLSDLGKKAVDILKKIGYVSEEEIRESSKKVAIEEERGETPIRSGYETKVISGMLSYEFTEKIARMYKEKGIRLIFRDIIKLVIDKMPKELFDEVVEEIDDCLTVHCPSELSDLVQVKSKEVFSIKVADRRKSFTVPLDLSFIGNIVSGVVSNVLDIVPKMMQKEVVERKFRLVVDEEYSLDDINDVSVECSSGIAELYFGDSNRLKIWSRKAEPNVDIDKRGDFLVIDMGGDKVELRSSKDDFRRLKIDSSGGVIKVESGNFGEVQLDVNGAGVSLRDVSVSEMLKVDISGGVANISINKDVRGTLVLAGELSGGVLKMEVRVPEGTKIRVASRHLGGYINVKRGGKRLFPGYVDSDFEYAESRLEVKLDLSGGYADIQIRE